jgi:hypothetical protein
MLHNIYLIEQVIFNVEFTIVCNDNNEKVVLMLSGEWWMINEGGKLAIEHCLDFDKFFEVIVEKDEGNETGDDK